MKLETVCISFTHESEGEKIGQLVAAELGFRFVDDEIIFKAADHAGVEPERVAAAEQQQSLIDRLFELLSTAQATVEPLVGAADTKRTSAASSDELREVIRAAIHEVGRRGRVVICAHGASMALAEMPGVLRVLVTAPEELRIDRLAERLMLTRAEASARVTDSDDARRDFFRNFYKVTEEQPVHYDLVLNTEHMSVDLAKRLIVTAARG